MSQPWWYDEYLAMEMARLVIRQADRKEVILKKADLREMEILVKEAQGKLAKKDQEILKLKAKILKITNPPKKRVSLNQKRKKLMFQI